MVCQYPTPGPVSSEKHQMTSEAGVKWRGGHTAGVGTVMVGMGGSRLAQDLQDVAAACRPCSQQEHPVVRPRHCSRQGYLAPADQPDLGTGVMDGVIRGRHEERRSVAGMACRPGGGPH
jgi:hypothetical protein